MILANKVLTLNIDEKGGELISIIKKSTNKEYLWQGDPKFWKRHSPVLFPIVGSLWNGKYKYKGKEYQMSQHGFARDMTFNLFMKEENLLGYYLESSQETYKNYPFIFRFEIFYQLLENKIKVIWKVINKGKETMYFQIGAHPAFNYSDFNKNDKLRGYFLFDDISELSINLIGEKSCMDPSLCYYETLKDHLLPITRNTFDRDALILENEHITKVRLLDKNKEEYLNLSFNMPVVGLWSPSGETPFVCIEPWWGRCDAINFTGELKDRKWINTLKNGEIFNAFYLIEIK